MEDSKGGGGEGRPSLFSSATPSTETPRPSSWSDSLLQREYVRKAAMGDSVWDDDDDDDDDEDDGDDEGNRGSGIEFGHVVSSGRSVVEVVFVVVGNVIVLDGGVDSNPALMVDVNARQEAEEDEEAEEEEGGEAKLVTERDGRTNELEDTRDVISGGSPLERRRIFMKLQLQ